MEVHYETDCALSCGLFYTARPEIKNRATVARAIEWAYPRILREQGIGGTVTVRFFLDEEGNVTRALVNKSSGYKALDEAALEVANVIEFTPALNQGKGVPVWYSLPITFSSWRSRWRVVALRISGLHIVTVASC